MPLASAVSFPSTRKYQEELFICVRLHPDMLAKSYEPDALFVAVLILEKIGSRNWRPNLDEVAQTERVKKQKGNERNVAGLGRLIFVQGTEEGYRRFLGKLDLSTRLLPPRFQEDIQKVEQINFLTPQEQLQGFRESWERGRVEIVLHPSRGGQERQRSFFGELFDELHVSREKCRPAFYGS